MSITIEVDSDLALQDHEQLGADIAFREHRFVLDVVASDHQAVDACELLQRQRAEKRYPLERDQFFHVFTGPTGSRFGSLLDPLISMALEHLQLGVRQATCRPQVEGFGIEKPRQRPSEPARAEVQQRLLALSPGLWLA